MQHVCKGAVIKKTLTYNHTFKGGCVLFKEQLKTDFFLKLHDIYELDVMWISPHFISSQKN